MEIIGWIGAILFAICAIPQAIQCYTQKHAHGLNWVFLVCWFFGEIFTIVYVWPKGDVILLTNYFFNLALLTVILYYKIFPRNQND